MKMQRVVSSFEQWLDQYMRKKSGGADVPARVVVVLAVLERLRTQPQLDEASHLTINRQQLIEHNRFVDSALTRYQLESPLKEHGRRASNVAAWIQPLFSWLSVNGFAQMQRTAQEDCLEAIGKIAAARVKLMNEAEPLVARFNRGNARAVVLDLLDQAQAKNRAKDVAEYLIGAKLQMLYGESAVQPKNVNTPSSYADFVVGKTAIEVTINAADKRHLDQIAGVLNESTLDFWLFVRIADREKWQNAIDASFDEKGRSRILVEDVETFLCLNAAEKGRLEPVATRAALAALFEVYNQRWLPTAGGSGLRIESGDPQAESE